jgi:hypothetical protein
MNICHHCSGVRMSSRTDLRAPKFNQEKGGLEGTTSRLLKQSVVRRNGIENTYRV